MSTPDNVMTITLGRRALHGLVWMLARNVVGRACGLASQIILAAWLMPADFGVIGITYTITTITSAFLNIGLDDVMLQRHRGLRHWVGPAFWLNLMLASFAAALVIGLSPFVAAIYKAPDLIGLSAILAVSMPLNALSIVPTTMMRARMQFSIVALSGTLEIVIQSLSTIGLAWAGFGVYSFVIPVPLVAALKAAGLWHLIASKISIRPHRRFRSA